MLQAKKYKIKSNSVVCGGFTLVETLIAISILLVSIVGPLTIASRGLTTASFARDQVTAFYLAQEAAEVVRNKRDNNALLGISWDSGLSECVGQSCIIDATKDIEDSEAIQSCVGVCGVIKQDAVSGLYGYTPSWVDSKFTRTMTMSQINSGEIQLTISIAWSNGSINKTFSIQENLLDWQ